MIKRRKYVLALVIVASMTFLAGCSNQTKTEGNKTGERVEDSVKNGTEKVKEGAEKAGDAVKNGVEKAGDAVKNGTEDVKEGIEGGVDKLKDNMNNINFTDMSYSEDELIRDLKSNGLKIEEVDDDDDNNYFSEDKDIYTANGEKIWVYEYDRDEQKALENDIKSIKNKGSMINGNKVNWTTGPHFYKKGRVVVVYDGNNKEVLKALNKTLGNAFIK